MKQHMCSTRNSASEVTRVMGEFLIECLGDERAPRIQRFADLSREKTRRQFNHDIVCPYEFPHLLASKDARHW